MTGEQVYAPLKPVSRGRKSYRVLIGVVVLLAVGLMIYAQTDAFAWDEGWHLLAAQSITRGKRLYLDFNYSQTPLNAYWNAFWFSVFGTTWRTAHAIAALMTSGAIMLTADYVFVRFPVARWRATAAIMTALLIGLNVLIVQYGPLGQAYGLALFLVVAAFRATVLAVERKNDRASRSRRISLFGGRGGHAAFGPRVPGSGNLDGRSKPPRETAGLNSPRSLRQLSYPFLPVAYLFSKGPRQTLFDIIQYNLLFRQVDWPDAIPHDFDVMFSWLNSAQALLAGLLGLAGLLFIRFRSDWNRAQRAEFYLCGWLALALGTHISSAHPTFQRYYLFAYPFVIILATAGLYFVTPRLCPADRHLWPMVALTAIFSLELAKALHTKHENVNWFDLQKIAAKVDEVTPRNGTLLSDEPIYFLTRRPPPHGMELADSHKLEFPPERAVPLNLVPESEVLREIKAGRFDTVVNCDKNNHLTDEDLEKVFREKFESDTCDVFWNFKGPQ